MAVAHALPRQVAFFIETAFGTGGPAGDDWATHGTYCYITNIDTSGLAQQTVENENNVLRPRQIHNNIATLRSGNMSFGLYLHGHPTAAAEGDAATTYHIAQLAYAALGGRDLGYAAAVVTSGDEEENELEIGADPGYAQGDWIYYYHAATGIGEFYRIASIADGPPITLTLDRDLHVAVVDRSENDTIRAVIDCYVHAYATTQHDHTHHKTLQILCQGDLEGDVIIGRGCKPNLTIEPITAGTPLQLSFDVMTAAFTGADETVKEDFGAAVPVGEAPLVPGQGSSTKVKMADFGDPLTTVPARGSVTVNPGVAYDPVEGPNGYEGRHGYVDGLAPATLEMMVPFDSTYNAEFRAQTHKHALIQVGDGTDAVGFYFPELEYASEPPRNDEGSLTGSTLTFRGHENSASAGALTGDNFEKWKSVFHMLLVA